MLRTVFLCLPVGPRDGRRLPKPTNQKLPPSPGERAIQSKPGQEQEGICVRGCYKEVILAEWHKHTNLKKHQRRWRNRHRANDRTEISNSALCLEMCRSSQEHPQRVGERRNGASPPPPPPSHSVEWTAQQGALDLLITMRNVISLFRTAERTSSFSLRQTADWGRPSPLSVCPSWCSPTVTAKCEIWPDIS